MTAKYLGRIPYSQALLRQNDARQTILASDFKGVILGFESEPVITYGARAADCDFKFPRAELESRGFELLEVDRGGQATIHNPGQLVIFPVWAMRSIGARRWVESLAEITRLTLAQWNITSQWRDDQPGLHTAHGKIMACGVRIRQGISTHGVALNVHNNLADFALIRSCGISSAPLDRMGDGVDLPSIFAAWVDNFRSAHG
jgi:lipoyl(octanoyl) transferase